MTIRYELLGYPEAVKMGFDDKWGYAEDVSEWEEPRTALFRIENGVAVEEICMEGHYDSPEDNFFYRHYSPVITELNKLAARLPEVHHGDDE